MFPIRQELVGKRVVFYPRENCTSSHNRNGATTPVETHFGKPFADLREQKWVTGMIHEVGEDDSVRENIKLFIECKGKLKNKKNWFPVNQMRNVYVEWGLVLAKPIWFDDDTLWRYTDDTFWPAYAMIPYVNGKLQKLLDFNDIPILFVGCQKFGFTIGINIITMNNADDKMIKRVQKQVLAPNPAIMEELQNWEQIQKSQILLLQGPYTLDSCTVSVYSTQKKAWHSGVIAGQDLITRIIEFNDWISCETDEIDPRLTHVIFDNNDSELNALLKGDAPSRSRKMRKSHGTEKAKRKTKLSAILPLFQKPFWFVDDPSGLELFPSQNNKKRHKEEIDNASDQASSVSPLIANTTPTADVNQISKTYEKLSIKQDPPIVIETAVIGETPQTFNDQQLSTQSQSSVDSPTGDINLDIISADCKPCDVVTNDPIESHVTSNDSIECQPIAVSQHEDITTSVSSDKDALSSTTTSCLATPRQTKEGLSQETFDNHSSSSSQYYSPLKGLSAAECNRQSFSFFEPIDQSPLRSSNSFIPEQFKLSDDIGKSLVMNSRPCLVPRDLMTSLATNQDVIDAMSSQDYLNSIGSNDLNALTSCNNQLTSLSPGNNDRGVTQAILDTADKHPTPPSPNTSKHIVKRLSESPKPAIQRKSKRKSSRLPKTVLDSDLTDEHEYEPTTKSSTTANNWHPYVRRSERRVKPIPDQFTVVYGSSPEEESEFDVLHPNEADGNSKQIDSGVDSEHKNARRNTGRRKVRSNAKSADDSTPLSRHSKTVDSFRVPSSRLEHESEVGLLPPNRSDTVEKEDSTASTSKLNVEHRHVSSTIDNGDVINPRSTLSRAASNTSRLPRANIENESKSDIALDQKSDNLSQIDSTANSEPNNLSTSRFTIDHNKSDCTSESENDNIPLSELKSSKSKIGKNSKCDSLESVECEDKMVTHPGSKKGQHAESYVEKLIKPIQLKLNVNQVKSFRDRLYTVVSKFFDPPQNDDVADLNTVIQDSASVTRPINLQRMTAQEIELQPSSTKSIDFHQNLMQPMDSRGSRSQLLDSDKLNEQEVIIRSKKQSPTKDVTTSEVQNRLSRLIEPSNLNIHSTQSQRLIYNELDSHPKDNTLPIDSKKNKVNLLESGLHGRKSIDVQQSKAQPIELKHSISQLLKRTSPRIRTTSTTDMLSSNESQTSNVKESLIPTSSFKSMRDDDILNQNSSTRFIRGSRANKLKQNIFDHITSTSSCQDIKSEQNRLNNDVECLQTDTTTIQPFVLQNENNNKKKQKDHHSESNKFKIDNILLPNPDIPSLNEQISNETSAHLESLDDWTTPDYFESVTFLQSRKTDNGIKCVHDKYKHVANVSTEQSQSDTESVEDRISKRSCNDYNHVLSTIPLAMDTNDTPSHETEVDNDTPSHETEADIDTPSHGTEADEDISLNGAEVDEDTQSHETEADEDIPSHGTEADNETSSHGLEAGKDTSSNRAEVDEDTSSHRMEADKDIPPHETEAYNDTLSRGIEADNDTPSHRLEADKDTVSHSQRLADASSPQTKYDFMKDSTFSYNANMKSNSSVSQEQDKKINTKAKRNSKAKISQEMTTRALESTEEKIQAVSFYQNFDKSVVYRFSQDIQYLQPSNVKSTDDANVTCDIDENVTDTHSPKGQNTATTSVLPILNPTNPVTKSPMTKTSRLRSPGTHRMATRGCKFSYAEDDHGFDPCVWLDLQEENKCSKRSKIEDKTITTEPPSNQESETERCAAGVKRKRRKSEEIESLRSMDLFHMKGKELPSERLRSSMRKEARIKSPTVNKNSEIVKIDSNKDDASDIEANGPIKKEPDPFVKPILDAQCVDSYFEDSLQTVSDLSKRKRRRSTRSTSSDQEFTGEDEIRMSVKKIRAIIEQSEMKIESGDQSQTALASMEAMSDIPENHNEAECRRREILQNGCNVTPQSEETKSNDGMNQQEPTLIKNELLVKKDLFEIEKIPDGQLWPNTIQNNKNLANHVHNALTCKPAVKETEYQLSEGVQRDTAQLTMRGVPKSNSKKRPRIISHNNVNIETQPKPTNEAENISNINVDPSAKDMPSVMMQSIDSDIHHMDDNEIVSTSDRKLQSVDESFHVGDDDLTASKRDASEIMSQLKVFHSVIQHVQQVFRPKHATDKMILNYNTLNSAMNNRFGRSCASISSVNVSQRRRSNSQSHDDSQLCQSGRKLYRTLSHDELTEPYRPTGNVCVDPFVDDDLIFSPAEICLNEEIVTSLPSRSDMLSPQTMQNPPHGLLSSKYPMFIPPAVSKHKPAAIIKSPIKSNVAKERSRVENIPSISTNSTLNKTKLSRTISLPHCSKVIQPEDLPRCYVSAKKINLQTQSPNKITSPNEDKSCPNLLRRVKTTPDKLDFGSNKFLLDKLSPHQRDGKCDKSPRKKISSPNTSREKSAISLSPISPAKSGCRQLSVRALSSNLDSLTAQYKSFVTSPAKHDIEMISKPVTPKPTPITSQCVIKIPSFIYSPPSNKKEITKPNYNSFVNESKDFFIKQNNYPVKIPPATVNRNQKVSHNTSNYKSVKKSVSKAVKIIRSKSSNSQIKRSTAASMQSKTEKVNVVPITVTKQIFKIATAGSIQPSNQHKIVESPKLENKIVEIDQRSTLKSAQNFNKKNIEKSISTSSPLALLKKENFPVLDRYEYHMKVLETSLSLPSNQKECTPHESKKTIDRVTPILKKPKTLTLAEELALKRQGIGVDHKDALVRKRGRRPHLPDPDNFYLQEGCCLSLPKLPKCRDCKFAREETQRFCRFTLFRRLYSMPKSGKVYSKGFSSPEQACETDLLHWVAKKPVSLDVDHAIYILSYAANQFLKIVKEESKAYQLGTQSNAVAWKRAVQGVRELCDVCATTIFNIHWVCEKCGFGVCLDCYYCKMEHDSRLSTDGTRSRIPFIDSSAWISCAPGVCHRPQNLTVTQIIPRNVLWILRKQVILSCRLVGVELNKNNLQIHASELTNLAASSTASALEPIVKSNNSNSILLKPTTAALGDGKKVRTSTIPCIKETNTSNSNGTNCPLSTLNALDVLAAVAISSTTDTKKEPHLNYSGLNTSLKLFTSPLQPSVPSHYSMLCDNTLLWLTDGHHEKSQDLFLKHWKKGEPVVVSGITNRLNQDLWTPASFEKEFGEETADVVNCLNGKILPGFSVRKFWKGFESITNRPYHDSRNRMLLKLKDWPPGADFSDKMPVRFNDLMQALPFHDYTQRHGIFNLVTRLPDFFAKPDLGPKMYNAYGSASFPSAGTTNLHLDMSDAVNVMVYVGIPQDDVSDMEIQDTFTTVDLACCRSTQRRIRQPKEFPGALWHIYRSQDADEIRVFLKKVAQERKMHTSTMNDPIHDQAFYLDADLRDRLQKEHNVIGWAICQCLGDAVFIPAGAPHQVLNLHSCIKVAEDFVTPENIDKCCQLTQEFRHLSDQHTNHEDKLQVKNILFHTMKDAVAALENYKTRNEIDDKKTSQ